MELLAGLFRNLAHARSDLMSVNLGFIA